MTFIQWLSEQSLVEVCSPSLDTISYNHQSAVVGEVCVFHLNPLTLENLCIFSYIITYLNITRASITYGHAQAKEPLLSSS